MAAHFTVQFAIAAQCDGFRADGQAVGHRALQQAAGAVWVEQVVVADKARGEQVHRGGIESFGVAALDDTALVHQEDAV
ncbi:hypothetical protein D3C79_1038900 [compost metagenome]